MTDRVLVATVLVLLIITLAWVVSGLGLVEALAGLTAPIFLDWWILQGQRTNE